MFLMFALILADGLRCAWFIPILRWCWCPEMGTSSIDLAQLSRFYLKTETESSFRNAVCLNKKPDDVTHCVQKHNDYITNYTVLKERK
jgi:hypothetical protein